MDSFSFSKKEEELFLALNLGEFLDIRFYKENPLSLYRIAVDSAFNHPEKYSQKAIDSLRRCNVAIHETKIYRKTEEFDDLIQL